ncbi:MAG: strawberry notch family protein, partial [Cyanobacteriota bacterium]|nr:strawberry notch family protein [Cyanobacteriota bacterium]
PHTVLGTAYIDGGAYAKQGTRMDTRLTIVDKAAGCNSNYQGYPYNKQQKRFDPKRVQEFLNTIPPRQTAKSESPKPKSESKAVPKRQRSTPTAPTHITLPTAIRGELLAYRERFDKGNLKEGELYTTYTPQRIEIATAKPHPTTLCESISLASVKPPLPTYRPLLPANLIHTGTLSEPQLESIIYAGESHSKWLGYYIHTETGELLRSNDKDPKAQRYRQGWFLGDGTGCGKGRQIAGIILDNGLQGNTKALWISKSSKLIEDARRDWEALGGDRAEIISLGKFAIGEPITLSHGILFTTYATLRGSKPNKKTRVQQIIDWLGPEFSGALAFDEAHAMGNASPEQSENWGRKKASQQGTAGVQLQNALPRAKVIYASATGATKANNLGYATRLGLWNSKLFPFSSAEDFIAAIAGGGIAAIEVFCRDLKALGLYLARTLSFEGVERETLESPLTPEQIEIYDRYAETFKILHNNLEEALRATNIMGTSGKTYNRNAKAAALSNFESTKQKFFNHLIGSMKTPTAIRAIEADLEAGCAAVVQLISTGEELLNRRLAEIPTEEWNDLNIDLTPRDKILDYLKHAFPVQLYETYSDEAGDINSRPLTDEKGNPILSREAVEKRDRLIEDLALLPPMPAALDLILHHFGTDRVAEITGRSKRVLRDPNTGCLKVSQRSSS